jgi:hypothetical protein
MFVHWYRRKKRRLASAIRVGSQSPIEAWGHGSRGLHSHNEYLFNLAQDERERANRAGLEPTRLDRMRSAFETWDARMPPVPPEAKVLIGYSAKDMPAR